MGNPVALETLRVGAGYRRVRFLAERVPAMGYRVYRMERRQTANAAPVTKPGNVIENAFYRVTVDPNRGGISSIFDKQIGRELVDPRSPYLLDQYLYVSGGEGTRLIHITEHLPAANLTVSPSGGAAAVNVRLTPWGSSLSYRVSGLHAPEIGVEIRLFDGEKKIEIVNRVKKEPVKRQGGHLLCVPLRRPESAIRV